MSNAHNLDAQKNPFPGLRPFREEEEYLFFGRESQVDAMVNKLATTHFLAVVGTSGSGKSSLVNCGLRPALRRGLMAQAGTSWRMAQFRPGGDPLGTMARALAQDGVLFRDYEASGLSLEEIIDTTLRMSKLGLIDICEQAQLDKDVNLLVVVDQFEELFRYRQTANTGAADAHSIKEEIRAFVNLLLEAIQQTKFPIYVVLTMRSDFLGDCAQYPGLAEAINAGQYLVPRMTRDERRAAITGPVHVGGANLSPVLLTRLVNDVGDNPDQLSIQQHALHRTWDYWQREGAANSPLDLSHYQAIGTMAHALDQHAEMAYAELKTDRQQQICAKLFKALTDKATDPRGVRRPTTLGTLCTLTDASTEEVTAVIAVFSQPSRSFLMPPAEETLTAETVIDISHESLMRVWHRLNTWADEEASSARIYRRLVETSLLYRDGHAALWQDPDLQLALKWREHNQPNAVWASRYHPEFHQAMEFLDKSVAERERLQKLEDEQRLQALRRSRKVAWGAAMFSLLLMIALGFVRAAYQDAAKAYQAADLHRIKAETARDQAYKQFRQATGLRLTVEAEGMLSSARAGGDERALLQLLVAQVIESSAETEAILLETLQRERALRKLATTSAVMVSVAFSPDGTHLVSASRDKTLQLWDVASGQPIGAPLTGHTDGVISVAYSPDGTRLASGSRDGTIRLWDTKTGKPIGEPLVGHEDYVYSVAFSPDGTRLVSGSWDKSLRLWDVASGQPIGAPLTGHTDKVYIVAFSPDGTRIVSSGQDKTLRLWDAMSGQAIGKPLTGHEKWVSSVAFSPDGKRIVSGSADKTLRLWDAITGKPLGAPMMEQEDYIYSVAFSPDGTHILSASFNGTLLLWDATTRKPIGMPWAGHKDKVLNVAFSPDGKGFASVSEDMTLRFWDVNAASGRPIGMSLKGHEGWVMAVAFSPDGKRLVSGSKDKTLRLWDVASGQPIGTPLQGHEDSVYSVAFSPDGKRIVSGSADKTLRLWDADSGRPIGMPLQGHEDSVYSVAFSPDGKRIVSGSADKTLRLWDVASGQPIGMPLQGHEKAVIGVAFSPDGTHIVSGSADKTLRLWDAASGKEIQTLTGHEGYVYSVAFSPNGKRIVSASWDKTLRLWDATNGQPIGMPLVGHKDKVFSVAFSPDGKRLVSASWDKTLRLWDADNGQPIGAPLQAQEDALFGVAFSPDGKRIVSASKDGTLQIWPAPKSWPEELCKKLTRNMSHKEWSEWVSSDIDYIEQCNDLPIPN